MCFDHDSRPPIPPIAGGALDSRALTLTRRRRQPVRGVPGAAARADRGGHHRPARRPRPAPLLRGARAAVRRARASTRSRSTTSAGPRRRRAADERVRVHAARRRRRPGRASRPTSRRGAPSAPGRTATASGPLFTIGFCMGGRIVVPGADARARPRRRRSASTAGRPGRRATTRPRRPTSRPRSRAPVLGIFGGADQGIPADARRGVRAGARRGRRRRTSSSPTRARRTASSTARPTSSPTRVRPPGRGPRVRRLDAVRPG